MAPAAGDSGQRPAAGTPRLSSSPGRGHAPPGLYEVKHSHLSHMHQYTCNTFYWITKIDIHVWLDWKGWMFCYLLLLTLAVQLNKVHWTVLFTWIKQHSCRVSVAKQKLPVSWDLCESVCWTKLYSKITITGPRLWPECQRCHRTCGLINRVPYNNIWCFCFFW